MRPWLRRSLVALAALSLLLLGAGWWLVRSIDSVRLQRVAIDWMQANHARTLAFDGPMTLQLWPQPALSVQRVRLSEPGQPQQPFASIAEASLVLQLAPLLARREIDVERVAAKGVQLRFVRGADGRRNIDDLLKAAAEDGSGSSGRQTNTPISVERIELDDATLQVDDALHGIHGRLAIQRLALGPFAAERASPMHLQAQAELQQPAMSAAMTLDAGLRLAPGARSGAPPGVELSKVALQLRGRGFDFEDLDAKLQASTVRLDYDAAGGLVDTRLGLAAVQLQFSGKRLGWQVQSGQLGLARLQLDAAQRSIEMEKLALKLQGRTQAPAHGQGQTPQVATSFDVQLDWPALKVAGDTLQGGPVAGRLVLGGDQKLQLQLRSQAPSGKFERITLPALHADIDGQLGPRTLKGTADATLVLTPKPASFALQPLALALAVNDPSLPPLQLALTGQAQWSESAASTRIEGTINEQRVQGRIDVALDRARAFVDVDASFGTLDVNRFVAPAQRGAPAAPSAAATPVNLQPLQWADARLNLSVARLLRPPYQVDGLALQASINNGVLDLRQVSGRAWGGSFSASGSANAGDGRLALKLNANGVDLQTLLSDTLGFDGLRGRGRVDADLSSRGSTAGALRAALNGRITLALRPAAIRGLDLPQTLRAWRTVPEGSSLTVAGDLARQTEFSQLDGSFDVRDGIAHNTDLAGIAEFLRVSGEGSIDLNQGRIDYLLRARVVNSASGRAGMEMVMLNGVTVPVDLHGPFDNVQWQVHWPSVTAGVAVRSVPNAAIGAVGATAGVVGGVTGGVMRGAGSLLRGAGDLLRGGAPASAPSPAER